MKDEWGDDELRDAVEAYLDMLEKHNTNVTFVKKHYYEKLYRKYGRTLKSFEYRMQNISYVFYLMGRSWLPGLKPKQNVGEKNIKRIENFISQVENKEVIPTAVFESSVIETIKNNSLLKEPIGIKKPALHTSKISLYQRDVNVKAWILKNSKGVCELCRKIAPFSTIDGIPFLEIHHIKQLADGGSDTITNTVALCPNCHREIHYGVNKDEIRNKLYDSIRRLVIE